MVSENEKNIIRGRNAIVNIDDITQLVNDHLKLCLYCSGSIISFCLNKANGFSSRAVIECIDYKLSQSTAFRQMYHLESVLSSGNRALISNRKATCQQLRSLKKRISKYSKY